MCAPHPIPANASANATYYTPRALPDTIADARRDIDREARGDIAFHVILLAAVVGIIAAAILA